MSTEELFFNGVNGTTGDYLQPPLTPTEVSQIATQIERRRHLEQPRTEYQEDKFRTVSWITDPNDLRLAGWGVIFPKPVDDSKIPAHKNPSLVKEKLSVLIKLSARSSGTSLQRVLC